METKLNIFTVAEIDNNSNEVIEDNSAKVGVPSKDKTKAKKMKITKKVIEERLIAAFENDAKVMLSELDNSGMNVGSCKSHTITQDIFRIREHPLCSYQHTTTVQLHNL